MCDSNLTLAGVRLVTVLSLMCFFFRADFDFSHLRVHTRTGVCSHTQITAFFSHSLFEEISLSVSVNYTSRFFKMYF